MTTLKELRMWHWRQVIANRKLQNSLAALAEQPQIYCGNAAEVAEHHKQLADLHLSAVQVLNDSVPGVAEYDCIEEDARLAKEKQNG